MTHSATKCPHPKQRLHWRLCNDDGNPGQAGRRRGHELVQFHAKCPGCRQRKYVAESGERNREPAAGRTFGVASGKTAIKAAWPSATEVNNSSIFEKLTPNCGGVAAEVAEEVDGD